jgi:hypothetical protein
MPYPDLAIWETYAHRSELRPGNDHMLPFDNPPHYNYIYQPVPAPGTSFTLFDNLDENNEIGSCNVYAHAGSYGKELQVLYQAKANREEYEYLLRNYPTKAQLLAATTNNVNNINADSAYYPGAGTPCNCAAEKKVLCLPCGGAPIPGGNGQTYTGAMEVKTAWRELVPQDDASTFFTRKVIVYAPGPHGSIFSFNKTYALIGLHIIHKTQNHPNFVFATFEHVNVEKDDMGYILLDQNGNDSGSIQAQYPRLHPIPAVVDSSTAFVHRVLKKKNPRSIWQYYRLVGVQDTPINDTPVRSPDIGLPGSKLQRYVTALRHVEASRLAKPAH